ncbi:mRNA binding protein puf3 [Tulasnella sp. UAMH 9824]|nr:mRNA binding protein puf3 [Tulasnella sp. UAMH 9824]
MTTVSGTTSRKPSGSSTHSPGRSPSSSPLPGHKLVPGNAVFPNGMGSQGALKVIGGGWQDSNPLNVSRQRQATAAQAAALSAPRYEGSTSPSRRGFGPTGSPYSSQHAALPATNAYEGAENDLALGIKGLSVQDDLSIQHPKFATIQTTSTQSQQTQHHSPNNTNSQYFPQPDYSAYYGNPTPDSYGEYSAYSFRTPMDPSVYASPAPQTPRAPVYGGIPPYQMPSPVTDVLRSPQGQFFPGYTALSRQASNPYFYANASAAGSFTPQSPHVSSMMSPGLVGGLDDKKRDFQMQFGIQGQMPHPSNMLMGLRQSSASQMQSLGYGGVNYPGGMPGMGPRSASYSPGSYNMRVGNAYRVPGTPKGRRAGPDTSSSTTDSGVGLRSALLEEFRANKTRKWELRDIFGFVVEFSGDQHGSRFIQQKLEVATIDERNKVFSEIVPEHALSLMTDVFGNYVIQKLFEYGTKQQKDMLISTMTGHILALSLQMYGCRVVQKALEHIPPEQQSIFVNEIEGQVMKCVKDANGNHVIQKLIERVVPDRLSFIGAFKGNVHDLSTHPYGCRVLQRCFEHLAPEQTRPLLDELHRYTNNLMQDQFGNYVIQFVLEHGAVEDRHAIISSLSGHMLNMARHKFASNVCEKALVTSDSANRRVLISEILSTRPDGQNVIVIMMKDQYANYVLQRALTVAEGDQLDELMAKIRPQLINLRRYSNNYAKHLAAIERIMIERMPRNVPAKAAAAETEVPRSAFTDFRVTQVVETP